MSKVRGKPFQKGHDSRRHTFTRDECVDGFWAALESITSRYPDAIDRSGRHMACHFLRRGKKGQEIRVYLESVTVR